MPLEIGSQLGPYEIQEVLGSGTSGEVYRARDMKLGRQVALKILRPEVAEDEETIARFGREARALASLSSASVATIYGLEEYEGVRFLVLELVAGLTLKERIRGAGPLPVREAITVALDVAEALEASHTKGIIHRDLNPANIKITPGGKTKLLDFGLAKSVTPGSGDSLLGTVQTLKTKLGVVMGTPPYMSPEQTLAVPLDKRADIWAFGCILYEALVGRRAFTGPTIPDVWEAIQTRDPDWSALPPDTPPEARKLLERCLAKDIDQRLQDIREARVLLDKLARGEIPAPEESPPVPNPPEQPSPSPTEEKPADAAAPAGSGESDAGEAPQSPAAAVQSSTGSQPAPGPSAASRKGCLGLLFSLVLRIT
jgi:serine/threonine protein kinase